MFHKLYHKLVSYHIIKKKMIQSIIMIQMNIEDEQVLCQDLSLTV